MNNGWRFGPPGYLKYDSQVLPAPKSPNRLSIREAMEISDAVPFDPDAGYQLIRALDGVGRDLEETERRDIAVAFERIVANLSEEERRGING